MSKKSTDSKPLSGKKILGGPGDDVLTGGNGNDRVYGASGNDVLSGGAGNDKLKGASGHDTLLGGSGGDDLKGGSGNDRLNGGAGSDRVRGGSGNDVLVYNVSENAGASDAYDGGSGSDTLRVEFTRAEWERADVQADVARFIRFLDRDGDDFPFRAFNLRVEDIEQLEIVVDGAVVTPGDNPVDARDDVVSVVEEGAAIIHALANDSAPDGVATVHLVSAPAHGTLTLNADRTFTYVPGAFFDSLAAGETAAESFTYRVIDADGDSDVAAVVLTITGTNDAPAAQAASLSTAEDTSTSGIVVATDIDSAALTYSLATGVSHGTLSFQADGTYTYAPNANFHGTDGFTYSVSDGAGGTASAAVTITVDPVNDAPVAQSESYSTNEDTPLIIAAAGLLANDSDVDGDGLSAALVSGPAHGSLTLNADGSFSYTPHANFNGTDSYTYRASDGQLDSGTATVQFAIAAVNDDPTAAQDAYAVNEDAALLVDAAQGVLANDSDIDGDSGLTLGVDPISLVSTLGASVLLQPDGSFIYAPQLSDDIRAVAPGATIEDSFTYTLFDGNGGMATGTVNVTVSGVAATSVITGTPNDDFGIIGTAGDDVMFGLEGNDLMSGMEGDDRLVGGPGNDTVIGGAGADTFVLDADGADAVVDFTIADGDKLDIRDVLQTASGYDGANAFSGGYLQFLDNGAGSTLVQFDGDGGGNSFVSLATLTGALLTQADTANYIV